MQRWNGNFRGFPALLTLYAQRGIPSVMKVTWQPQVASGEIISGDCNRKDIGRAAAGRGRCRSEHSITGADAFGKVDARFEGRKALRVMGNRGQVCRRLAPRGSIARLRLLVFCVRGASVPRAELLP